MKVSLDGINTIFDKIAESVLKKKVEDFFYKDFANYVSKLSDIQKELDSGADPDDMLQEVYSISDVVVKQGDEIGLLLNDKIIIGKIKKFFREGCGQYVYQSDIVRRAYEKPRGYSGDYLLVEYIYNNLPISESKMGYCYDKYFLQNSYASAIKNRKDLMRSYLVNYLSQSKREFNVLNIACGSCREIKDLYQNFYPNLMIDNIKFTLVDQDIEALEFSRDCLEKFKNSKFDFCNHNVLEYVRDPVRYSKILGKQDLIYSIGLADYLPDRILKKLINFCFKLLNTGGEILLAHKDISKYKPLAPNWWCDWTFYPRNEQYLLDLISSSIQNYNVKVEREPLKVILYLKIQKIL